jgi:hypothetical protein
LFNKTVIRRWPVGRRAGHSTSVQRHSAEINIQALLSSMFAASDDLTWIS